MKIQANQLRIGNLLMYSGDIVKVKSTYITGFHCWKEDGISINNLQYNIPSIPITEELLIKMGFEGDEDERHIVLGLGGGEELSVELLTKTCCLTRANKDGNDDFVYIKYPDNVHELQNLYFSLTGQELELTK